MKPSVLLSIFIFLSGHVFSQTWKLYSDSAKYYQRQRDNNKAVDFLLKANEILKRDSAVSLSYYFNNNDLGDQYQAMGQYAKAEPFFAAGKDLIEKIQGKESTNYGLSCFNLGRLSRMMGKYPIAEALLKESLKVREKAIGIETEDYAHSTNNLGIVYVETGRYDEAKELYDETLRIREKVLGKDHVDYGASCNNMAILYVVTGRPYEAEPLYLEAKRIREKGFGKEHPIYAASCNNLAALYLGMGQYKKAEPLYLEAKQIREKTLGKEHPDYAASCDNYAILQMDIGNYEIAEALYKEGRQIRERTLGKKHIEYAKGCNNLALLYKLLGQYERSAALFSEAREIFAELVGREHFEYAICCNNLGAVYMDLDDYGKAAPLYDEARQIWAKVLGKEHNEYAKSCHNLALVALKNGDYKNAESLFLEANSIREKAVGKEHVDYAEGVDNLANVYLATKQFEKAIDLHAEGKKIREKALGIAHPDYLQSCINLANAYWTAGNNTMALNLYTEAFSSQQALLQKIFRFTTEPEQRSYLRKVEQYRSYFLSFSTAVPNEQTGVYTYEVAVANKNLTVNAAQRLKDIISQAKDTAIISVYNRWIDIREQLAFWYSKPLDERRIELGQLEEKAAVLEKELVRASASFKNEQQVKTWKDIQQSLQPGEAAIEFSSYQVFNGKNWTDSVVYVAIVIRKDKTYPQLIKLFDRSQLGALSRDNFGEQLVRRMYANAKQDNTSLYSLIWKPLESSLQGISTVYFSPAGELHKVSFAAIPVSQSQVLSDIYKLRRLHTTASLVDLPASSISTGDKLALFGGVQYDADSASIKRAVMQFNGNDLAKAKTPDYSLRTSIGDFYYLAGSEKEVLGIKSWAEKNNYTVTLNNGINATEESVKILSGSKAPAVLHIATHGFFFPDPSHYNAEGKQKGRMIFRYADNPLIRSGLALAGANNAWSGKPIEGIEDGILTAYEVANLQLPTTKLAVLSACETGLGEIQGSEGVYGLQRSFKMAGVENLVMSLWKVPDAETAEFMSEFYKNLFAKQAIHAAFTNAQMALRNKYRNDPFKWAAWVLVR